MIRWQKSHRNYEETYQRRKITIINTNPPTIGHGPDLREILQRRHNHLVWLVLQRLEDGRKEFLNQLERSSAKRTRKTRQKFTKNAVSKVESPSLYKRLIKKKPEKQRKLFVVSKRNLNALLPRHTIQKTVDPTECRQSSGNAGMSHVFHQDLNDRLQIQC